MFGKGGLTQTTLRWDSETVCVCPPLREQFLEKLTKYCDVQTEIHGNVLPCTKHGITAWFGLIPNLISYVKVD